MALIPEKNGMALAAYYCGVFGLIPCVGSLLGPVALVLGFLGLSKANREPEAQGKGHAIAGIVLGIIEIVLYIGGPILLILMGVFAANIKPR